jgi:hypothetical protein
VRRARAIAGAGCGFLVWVACYFLIKYVPSAVVFYVTAFAFIFGCGAVPLIPFEADTPIPERTAIACALGTALAPSLIYVLALGRIGFLFPPFAFVAAGTAAALWYFKPESRASRSEELRWYVILPLVMFAITAWVSSGRIRITADSIAVFGDYETFDLTYYAAIAAELAHTNIIPPLSPFFAGHRIIYSYFPLLLLAAIHNFSGVGMLETFLAFGWPLFAAVACAAVFAVFRRLGSITFAMLSTVLVFAGSSLAYVAAFLWPQWARFDSLIWSSMFMAPSGEWLLFNPWTPSLAVLFAGFYAMMRIAEPKGLLWSAIASVCFGLAFMFKSFSFEIVVPALLVSAAIAAWRKDASARRLMAVAVGAVLVAAPWLLAVLPYNQVENRGARVTIAPLTLVHRMLLKTGLIGPISDFLRPVLGSEPSAWAILAVATVIFLIGGLGTRWLGIVPLWRAAIGAQSMRPWTPLAWIVILGIAMSCVVDVAPFPNSLQTYLFALYMLWPFAVYTVWPPGARRSPTRWVATALLVALSVPATAHYALAAHGASAGQPLTRLDAADLGIIRYLRRSGGNRTMLLHSNPLWPSLYSIESERPVVLAWSSYVEGDGNPDVDALSSEVAAFFGSPAKVGVNDVGLLHRYHVTHVIERVATDQINPQVLQQLHLVTGAPGVRLYEVP